MEDKKKTKTQIEVENNQEENTSKVTFHTMNEKYEFTNCVKDVLMIIKASYIQAQDNDEEDLFKQILMDVLAKDGFWKNPQMIASKYKN